MTFIEPTIIPQTRFFPSRIALLAAMELVLIALLLRLSNSSAFFYAAVACSLCSIQLGILLINRFQVNTRQIRKVARHAEFSSQSVIITDAFGRIKWTNPRFTRVTGFYLSEIAGKTFGMVLHGQETHSQAVQNIRRHMRLGQPFDVEILEYNRAGETLWVSSKGEPVRDTRGLLTHYVVTQTDISDQHRLIEELGKSTPIQAGMKLLATSPMIITLDGDVPSSQVTELTRKLESLTARDDRDQLQDLVDGLKTSFDKCVDSLPKLAAEKAKKHPSFGNNE